MATKSTKTAKASPKKKRAPPKRSFTLTVLEGRRTVAVDIFSLAETLTNYVRSVRKLKKLERQKALEINDKSKPIKKRAKKVAVKPGGKKANASSSSSSSSSSKEAADEEEEQEDEPEEDGEGDEEEGKEEAEDK